MTDRLETDKAKVFAIFEDALKSGSPREGEKVKEPAEEKGGNIFVLGGNNTIINSDATVIKLEIALQS